MLQHVATHQLNGQTLAENCCNKFGTLCPAVVTVDSVDLPEHPNGCLRPKFEGLLERYCQCAKPTLPRIPRNKDVKSSNNSSEISWPILLQKVAFPTAHVSALPSQMIDTFRLQSQTLRPQIL